MATRFELVLCGEDEARLQSAGEAAVAEIAEVEQRLTRFASSSLVAFIEREGHARPVRLDADLFELFETCAVIRAASGGAFDVCHRSGGSYTLDSEAATLTLDAPGIEFDFGAIGKGFAIDLAVRALRELGVESALIHGGTSSVYGLGAPPSDAEGWKVALGLGDDVSAPVALKDRALSASAQYGRLFVDGSEHLNDPRSGAAAPLTSMAAVTAPTATLADGWSTAVAVLGTESDTVVSDLDAADVRVLDPAQPLPSN